ncbi:MAG: hypothetical protein ACJ8C3_00005, partial [Microvirga sp.]
PAARLCVPLRLQNGVGLCHHPVVLLCIFGPIGASPRLERDDFSSSHHPALSVCSSMIFSENRFPLFGIML